MIFRCPGPPCDRGPYCWQDGATKKHYRLLGHHLRGIVKSIQQGGRIESHGDVPDDIRKQLYAEDQQHSDRKRKRRNSDSRPTDHVPVVINNYIPPTSGQAVTYNTNETTRIMHGDRSPQLVVPGYREEAVEAYYEWHCSQVRSQKQKQSYKMARDLTLDRALDLEHVHIDSDAQFYIDHGVLEGVARRFVTDVKVFLDQYDAS
ncbi:hypothetical protein IQ07DRAFT_525749 [Pyrenochaeta sp. DS3sAY3a]|nr:hypothetical protein IQ07DRAFT_525749 [Pyrenochaeta sp. DS3sAY3a]